MRESNPMNRIRIVYNSMPKLSIEFNRAKTFEHNIHDMTDTLESEIVRVETEEKPRRCHASTAKVVKNMLYGLLEDDPHSSNYNSETNKQASRNFQESVKRLSKGFLQKLGAKHAAFRRSMANRPRTVSTSTNRAAPSQSRGLGTNRAATSQSRGLGRGGLGTNRAAPSQSRGLGTNRSAPSRSRGLGRGGLGTNRSAPSQSRGLGTFRTAPSQSEPFSLPFNYPKLTPQISRVV